MALANDIRITHGYDKPCFIFEDCFNVKISGNGFYQQVDSSIAAGIPYISIVRSSNITIADFHISGSGVCYILYL